MSVVANFRKHVGYTLRNPLKLFGEFLKLEIISTTWYYECGIRIYADVVSSCSGCFSLDPQNDRYFVPAKNAARLGRFINPSAVVPTAHVLGTYDTYT